MSTFSSTPGLPDFHNKFRPIATQNYPNRAGVKSRSGGVKIQVFVGVLQDKFAFQRVNMMLFGVASTRSNLATQWRIWGGAPNLQCHCLTAQAWACAFLHIRFCEWFGLITEISLIVSYYLLRILVGYINQCFIVQNKLLFINERFVAAPYPHEKIL